MQRVKRSTAIATLPAPPTGGTPGFFTGGDPGTGTPASVPGYEWFNGVQEELIGLILRGGIAASDADLAQVRKSLDRLFGGAYQFLNASTTLNIDQAGLIWVDASSTPITITLPLSAALNGRPLRYRIYKVGANTVTIQLQGSDLINGLSTLIMAGPNDVADLMSTGDWSWVALSNISASSSNRGLTRFATAAETDAGTLADVAVTPAGLGISTRNFANAGYARLPGGLIMQWGQTNSSDMGGSGVTLSATFPIAFPNAFLTAMATGRTTSNGSFSITDVAGTLTALTVKFDEWAAVVQNASAAYLAIGR